MLLFSRNRKAFEEKALTYMDSLYYMGLKLAQNEQRAQDLVQETYLRAFRNYKKYREDNNMKAWLMRILTNIFINEYRKRKRENFLFNYDDNENVYYNWVEDQSRHNKLSPEKSYFFKQLGGEIEQAMNELPEEARMMVLYADVYELSYKEIAEIIDAPMGTVMSKLYRARKVLQTKLYGRAQEMGLIEEKERKQAQKIIRLAR